MVEQQAASAAAALAAERDAAAAQANNAAAAAVEAAQSTAAAAVADMHHTAAGLEQNLLQTEQQREQLQEEVRCGMNTAVGTDPGSVEGFCGICDLCAFAICVAGCLEAARRQELHPAHAYLACCTSCCCMIAHDRQNHLSTLLVLVL